jgi:nucleotide-binding universal stress UspA family protein
MFNKILVPLDGSTIAEQAIAPAMALAKAIEGKVILLRSLIPVYATMPVVAYEYAWAWSDNGPEVDRQESRRYLETVEQSCQQAGVSLQTAVREGDAASVIVDMASEEKVDLIVMSAHGQAGVRPWLLGSVTERVLHGAHCPVLLVRSPDPISRIAITLDGSTLAESALGPGLELAAKLGARVTLLRVNEPIATPARPGPAKGNGRGNNSTPTPRLPLHLRDSCEAYLEEVVAAYNLTSPAVQTAVIDGPAVDSILEFAKLYGINLLVMSTHGRSGLRRWLYGSVTAKIMRGTSASMLIIRPPADEYDAS